MIRDCLVQPKTLAAALAFCATLGGIAVAQEPAIGNAAEPSAAEERVRRALRETTSADFVETPLSDALETLASRHGFPSRIDRRALADANIGEDAPVSLQVSGVSLRSALNLLLRPLDLVAIISNETLTVTTSDGALDADLPTRIYPVADLLRLSDGDFGDDSLFPTELAVELRYVVSPTSWDEAGGPGSMAPFGGVLIVSQTDRVHDEIAGLLAALRTARRRQADDAPDRFEPIDSNSSAIRTRLLAALQSEASLDVDEVPLSDVAARLQDIHKAPILVDGRAMADAEAPITLHVQDVTLRSLLRVALDELAMTWAIDNEVILLTTEGAARELVTTRTYPVADLLGDGSDYESLIDAIRFTVAPITWDDAGGKGGITYWAPAHALVCSQSDSVHRQIEALLKKLRQSHGVGVEAGDPASGQAAKQPQSVLRAYRLFAGRQDAPCPSSDEVAALVNEMVVPESWRDAGGDGRTWTLPGVLVVRHRESVHRRISKLLEQIGALSDTTAASQHYKVFVEPDELGEANFGRFSYTDDHAWSDWRRKMVWRGNATQIYRLIPRGGDDTSPQPDANEVERLVRDAVVGGGWNEDGRILRSLPGVLVVRHTGSTQRQIGRLLREMALWTPFMETDRGLTEGAIDPPGF